MTITRRDWILNSSVGAAGTLGLLTTAACSVGGAIPQAIENTPMPPFRARTLTGKFFNKEIISDKVLLLQFWATWCGYCKREQTPVDRITKEFENKGLIVLAVNVGESRDKVVEYLRERPRACHIVLQEDTDLVSAFQAEGFPKYVAVNRSGMVTGNQDGAGGMLALRDLLSGAGLRSS